MINKIVVDVVSNNETLVVNDKEEVSIKEFEIKELVKPMVVIEDDIKERFCSSLMK